MYFVDGIILDLVQYELDRFVYSFHKKDVDMIEEILKNLKEVNDEVKKRYKASIKGVFDSYVRGEKRKESDLDILVEFEPDADLIHFV